MKVFLFYFFLLSSHAYAEVGRNILACDAQDMKELDTSIRELKTKGYTSAHYLQNYKGEVVGLYSWKKDQAFARTCEVFFRDGVTVAHSWDFWDHPEFSTDPAKWNAGTELGLSQDQGMADFKVLKEDAQGKVKIDFLVWGFGPSSDVLIKKEILTFSKAL